MEVCISCGMPMRSEAEHAPGNPASEWCVHCSNPDGSLQDFDERFERMVQWEMRKKGISRGAAEESTRAYMRGRPAWQNHPKLRQPTN